ncbi:general secretion pathway protein GspB [Alteromonas sp. ZYF713]|nr:general secretion pathway protein GspB [Alteromonas sp. ZYF713]
MNQIIPIEQAMPGMMIVQVTAQNGPVKIKKSGLITSDAMIQGLIEMGVQEIEYDPEQTVEICTDEALVTTEQTPTQALLRGQYDTRAQKTDSAISDQFNRSLFLPTVNGLPGQWQRLVKPVMTGLLLTIGGCATGYFLAVGPAMLEQLLNGPDSVSERVVSQTVVAAPPTVASSPVAVIEDAKPSDDAAGTAEETSSSEQAATNIVSAVDRDITTPEPTEPDRPAADESAVSEDNESDKVAVSPELMARFNKVLTDLEKEEARGIEPSASETVVTVHDDIQRVDQLPARLLTRLPTMDFSAHMYASAPADRWVRVNGDDKGEGDWIADRVQIVNIEAQRVILRFEGEVFSMTALTDW